MSVFKVSVALYNDFTGFDDVVSDRFIAAGETSEKAIAAVNAEHPELQRLPIATTREEVLNFRSQDKCFIEIRELLYVS